MSGMRRLMMRLAVAFFLAPAAEAVGAETAPAAPAAPAPVAPAAPAPVAPAAPAPAATAPTPAKPSQESVWAGHMSAAEVAFWSRD